MLKCKLITYTPDAEKLVAEAAKLCYAKSDIDTLSENLTPDKVESFLKLLGDLGHESPIEHASFTFGIEGVSRSLLAQLTRHRIALPTSIELWQGGECVARQVADDAAEVDMLRENCRRLVYSFDLGGVSSGSTLVLKVMRPKGKINHIAIDEIRLKP